jgi:hypothetical protein
MALTFKRNYFQAFLVNIQATQEIADMCGNLAYRTDGPTSLIIVSKPKKMNIKLSMALLDLRVIANEFGCQSFENSDSITFLKHKTEVGLLT